MSTELPVSYTFPKSECLKSKKTIQLLFEGSLQVFQYPFKVMFLTHELQTTFPQVMFSVSKRSFKKAVDRNRIKRQMREAYRLQKPHVFTQKTLICSIAIIYVGKKRESYELISRSMDKVLKKLLTENIINEVG